MKLEKTYNAKKYEQKIYQSWEKGGFFRPEINPSGKPFGVVIPPPNITGELHLGQALCNTIKDIILRYRRMQGEKVLYVPGTDHAGIATQTVIEKELEKEGKKREDLGRKKFIEKAWEWKEKYGSQITDQLKRLGISCDWERERFTLDPELNKAVNKAFLTLYKDGLIYRGDYLVNWCPRCGTAISDLEVDYKDIKGKLWELKYPFKDDPDPAKRSANGLRCAEDPGARGKFVTVATTRPETMLGDTAVAVNPKDKRYKNLIGKTLILPLMEREIPVIADELVDQEFGTGAVKVTPAHDPNDFEIGKKHKLDFVRVIGEDGKMTKLAGNYGSLSTAEARKKVLEDLEKGSFLGNEKNYLHSVGHCQRCDEVVEPLMSKQWFVKMKPLVKPAIKAVKDKTLLHSAAQSFGGQVKVQPKRFEKIYFDWLNNIRDWCISRQLWWGHQIPVYYCLECDSKRESPIVSEKKIEECPKCKGSKIEQDPDVLDTWFSSALWPFSALGWPKITDDYKTFYPNDLMENGYDILFFWDARMIMMGLYFTKKIPFKHLYLHGMVLDRKGRKMSKSLGNGIDPIEMIDKYGADALRMSLVVGLTPGNDMRMYEEKIKGYRNFSNKLWNIARFVLDRTDSNSEFRIQKSELELADRWILHRMQSVVSGTSESIREYNLSTAGQELMYFTWDNFADWYLEISKFSRNREQTDAILRYVLERILKLAHPFMPFVTEAIWSYFDQDKKLIISDWPKLDKKFVDNKIEDSFDFIVIHLIIKIRNARSESKINPGKEIEILIDPGDEKELLDSQIDIIKKLAKVKKINYGEIRKGQKGIPVTRGVSFAILKELMDGKTIKKEKENLERYIDIVRKKLENKDFIKNAPKEIVEQEKKKLKDAEEKLKRL